MKNPLQGANTQMADPNEEPTIPQPAATVLLVRDSRDGVKFFSLKEHRKLILEVHSSFQEEKLIPKTVLTKWSQ